MTATTHTPAPWVLAKNPRCERANTSPHIAYAGGWIVQADPTDHAATDEPNARLIAAAPDLLAACESALRMLTSAVEAGGGGWDEDDPDDDRANESRAVLVVGHLGLNELRAAIAKAKGVPPCPAG